jgi:hypothetical protein
MLHVVEKATLNNLIANRPRASELLDSYPLASRDDFCRYTTSSSNFCAELYPSDKTQ